jgi:hypothetical protein
MINQDNPLSQYFRQPAIHVRLPSQGEFYPPNALTLPPNGEVPVLPMTAVDEITYRTPDALFNGSAVVSVIQSCVPAVRDPWSMPSIDIDALLIAIRIASFGHGMDLTTQCPSCNHQEEITIDLRSVNDGLRIGNYHESLHIGDLEVFFRPLSYQDVNENNQQQFEQQQGLRLLQDPNVDEKTKAEQLSRSVASINELTVRTIAQSIAVIKTPGAAVTEPEYIYEFLKNCDRAVFNRLRDHAIELRRHSEVQPVAITCSNCQHEYQQPFTLDMSSFFADAS